MPTTFIKLDRSLINWRWFQNQNTLQVWIYILLKANVTQHGFEKITVHRGELVTSQESLANATGLTVNKVRTALEHLKNTGEITVRKYPKFSVISVLNYDLYQGNSQAKHRVSTGSSQANHNNIIMKEEKNERMRECVNNTHAHGKFFNVFLTDTEYTDYKQRYPDIDGIIEELSEAIDTNPQKYSTGHTTSWLNKFIRQKLKDVPQTERRKMLT